MLARPTIAIATALAAFGFGSGPAQANMQQWITTFERLMSGVKVHDKQRYASQSQTQNVIKKSHEAGINAELAQEQAYRVADITNRYSYETGQGDEACTVAISLNGLTGAANSQDRILAAFHAGEAGYISNGGDAAANMRNSVLKRVGHYCTEEERMRLGATYCRARFNNDRNAGDSNAGPFLFNRSYGAEEVTVAGDYIDVLAPYPTIDPSAQDTAGRLALIEARRRAALLSGARTAIMRVAVSGMGGDR